MTARVRVPALVLLFLAAPHLPAAGQSVLERTPNLSGGWSGTPGTVYFNFLHRFTVGEPPDRQVINTPTFLVGAGLPGNILLAANYATRSDLVRQYPNEWEFFARTRLLKQAGGFPLDAGVQLGYNLAAESVDGEVSVNRQLGRLLLFGAARGMSRGYGQDSTRIALAGGASVQLTRWVALAGDVARLLDATDREKLAWGAALQVAIPYTPHSFSLQVTNTNTLTVQGASRGGSARRYGFEFTVPVHPGRFLGRPAATAAEKAAGDDSATGVTSVLRRFAFEPAQLSIAAGTTVVWRNEDQLMHTVKAGDASWESPQMNPGGSFRRTFSQPGRYQITCGPHPFMKQIVEVR